MSVQASNGMCQEEPDGELPGADAAVTAGDTPAPIVYRHYTDDTGIQGMVAQGVIIARHGRVYVTTDALDPQTAELALFVGNAAYIGRGKNVVEFVLVAGVSLQPGNQPNELIHLGSLRFGKHIKVLYAGKNPY